MRRPGGDLSGRYGWPGNWRRESMSCRRLSGRSCAPHWMEREGELIMTFGDSVRSLMSPGLQARIAEEEAREAAKLERERALQAELWRLITGPFPRRT